MGVWRMNDGAKQATGECIHEPESSSGEDTLAREAACAGELGVPRRELLMEPVQTGRLKADRRPAVLEQNGLKSWWISWDPGLKHINDPR